jgi:Tetratricopeptide repeat
MAIREKVLGSQHPDTPASLNNLALLLKDQGDLAAAQPLASGLEGDDLLVDAFELSFAVGMTAAFFGLAIDLLAVAKAFEQLGDAARRHLVPHVAQRRGELCMAL